MAGEQCPSHPEQAAKWHCDLCQKPLCELCDPVRWNDSLHCPECLKTAESKASEAAREEKLRRRLKSYLYYGMPLACILAIGIGFDKGCDAVNNHKMRRTYAAEKGPAPDFSATDLSGRPVSLRSYRGRVVVLDFWASWCDPCIRLIPDLKALHRDFAGEGVVLIGVNSDDSENALRAAVKAHGIDWPQVWDASGEHDPLGLKYGIYGIPATIIIDKEGRIFKRWSTWDNKMSTYVRFLLDQPSENDPLSSGRP